MEIRELPKVNGQARKSGIKEEEVKEIAQSV